MFAVHCPQHGSQVLLDVRRVTRLTNLGDGVIAVELTCYDGEHLFLMTGSRSAPRPPVDFDRLWALVIPAPLERVESGDRPATEVTTSAVQPARRGRRVAMARSLRAEIPDLGAVTSVWIALQARLGRRPAALVGRRSQLEAVSARLRARHDLVAILEPV
ncbi:MAG: hypothetical protein ACR2JK_06500 [Geodermatophilaceae bacterium]